MKGRCSAEARAACPFVSRACFTDEHHLAFPANRYRTRVERRWRELEFNKTQIPRCIHDAIHASGYFPAKPDREVMTSEIWGSDTGRAEAELGRQLFLGELALERDGDIA